MKTTIKLNLMVMNYDIEVYWTGVELYEILQKLHILMGF